MFIIQIFPFIPKLRMRTEGESIMEAELPKQHSQARPIKRRVKELGSEVTDHENNIVGGTTRCALFLLR